MFSVKWWPICRHWLFNLLINGIKILFLSPALTTVSSCCVTVSTESDFPQLPQHSGCGTPIFKVPSLPDSGWAGLKGWYASTTFDSHAQVQAWTDRIKLLQSIQPVGRGCRHPPAFEFSCHKRSQAKHIPFKTGLHWSRRINLRSQCHYSLFNSAT